MLLLLLLLADGLFVELSTRVLQPAGSVASDAT